MMEERILFVDDDPNILEAYQRKLRLVLRVHTALGPYMGLREIKERGPFAVVVADMNMPVMNGIEFLKEVRETSPDIVRMMLTGNADIKTAMDAVNEGSVFRFLTKPCPSKLMGESLLAAIKQHRLVTAEREVLEGTLKGTAELLTEILSWVSPNIFGRAVLLRNTVKKIAGRLKIEDTWETELSATLCQIGMLAIPSDVLEKVFAGEDLTDLEQKAVEGVPAVSNELLERIPRLENVTKNILYQNKRFDGEGFPPDKTAGKDLPLGGRILKVAGDYHELRARRHVPRRMPRAHARARGILRPGRFECPAQGPVRRRGPGKRRPNRGHRLQKTPARHNPGLAYPLPGWADARRRRHGRYRCFPDSFAQICGKQRHPRTHRSACAQRPRGRRPGGRCGRIRH